MPAQNRGASSLRAYQGTVALAWKDSQPVHFLSTAHYPDEVATVQCQQKDRRTGQFNEVKIETQNCNQLQCKYGGC